MGRKLWANTVPADKARRNRHNQRIHEGWPPTDRELVQKRGDHRCPPLDHDAAQLLCECEHSHRSAQIYAATAFRFAWHDDHPATRGFEVSPPALVVPFACHEHRRSGGMLHELTIHGKPQQGAVHNDRTGLPHRNGRTVPPRWREVPHREARIVGHHSPDADQYRIVVIPKHVGHDHRLWSRQRYRSASVRGFRADAPVEGLGKSQRHVWSDLIRGSGKIRSEENLCCFEGVHSWRPGCASRAASANNTSNLPEALHKAHHIMRGLAAAAFLIALATPSCLAQGFRESAQIPLNDTSTGCAWCVIGVNLVGGSEPREIPAASYFYERATLTASSNVTTNLTILFTQKQEIQNGSAGSSGSELMGRILAETDGRLVNWVNAVNNGWAYSGLRISSSNASADLAITLKLNALQLQGARNNSVFQGVPGRSLVLFRFDRTLRNVVGQPIRNALNLNNVENRGLWEYTYSLSEGEYIFVAYPNTSRIPQELTKDVFVPGDSIYRTFGFWLKNQVPASTFEKLSVGLASGEPTQMVVDTAVAQTVPNSTYTLLPNAAWQILTNPVVGPTQLSSKIMYAYDQADTAVIPVQRMNFAFFNGTDYEPLPSYYDGNTLFTNATFVGNGWTSLAITNQIGSNFSIPAPTTSATASATSTMTRTASKTMRPDAIPDATTQGSGASRLAFSLLQLVALMLTVAIMQL